MTHGTFRLGRIFKIPVSANWSALFGALFISLSIGGLLPPAAGWAGGLGATALSLAGALLFSASLLAHELGHALVARRRGVDTAEITLWMFGGVAKITSEPTTPSDELKIAVAGPLVSLSLAATGAAVAATLAIAGAPTSLVTLAWILAFVNGSLGLFNLLPGLPLDGGRILRAWQWKRHGDRDRATLAAARGGRFVGGGLMLVGVLTFVSGGSGLWTMALGAILWTNARVEGLRVRWQIARRRADAAMGAPAPDFGDNGFGGGFGPPSAPGGPFVDVRSWPASPTSYPSDLSMWPSTEPTSAGKRS